MPSELIRFIQFVLSYLLITTAVNILLMGFPRPKFSRNQDYLSYFVIEKTNYFALQEDLECAAFSSAYVLRHLGKKVDGNELYREISQKDSNGRVYPRDIIKLLARYGVKSRFYMGSIEALKKEISKGTPVIALIRVSTSGSSRHFVPLVGYDEHYFYAAESMQKLVNAKHAYYNRRIEIDEFSKLWNTSVFYMPLIRNTYIAIEN